MSNWKSDGLRTWVLGAAATGLICQSIPALAQTRNSIFSTRKSPASKPVPARTVEPPRLLAVTDDSGAADSVQPISQIAAATDEKSEVQKQVEALYKQDGREMPNMNMNLQPMTPKSLQTVPATTQPATQTPATPATPTNPGLRFGKTIPQSTQQPVRPAQATNQNQLRTQATPYPLQSNNQATPYPQNSQPAQNFNAAIEAQAQPSQQPQQPRQNPVIGFFKRIGGGNKQLATQAPIPPDYKNTVSNTPLTSGQAPAVTPANQTAMKYMAPPTPSQQTSPAQFGSVQITAGIGSMPAELPQTTFAVPSLSPEALPLKIAATQNSLPPLMSEPQQPLVAEVQPPLLSEVQPQLLDVAQAPTLPPLNDLPPLKTIADGEQVEAPAKEIAADFPNPFPEVTESEADKKVASAPKEKVSALDIEVAAKETNVTEPQTKMSEPETKATESKTTPEVTEKSDEDPFAVGTKDFAEPSIDENVESTTPTIPKLDAPPVAATQPENNSPSGLTPPPGLTPPSTDNARKVDEIMPPVKPSFDTGAIMPPVVIPDATPDPQIEKMRRIRERFGMKGLKGFCPVTLHDERELIDARPEFHFTYRSQKFHFASAEARDSFEADPSKYAPAAYGADVVALSRDKDVVEGTLDFAAWYKGRLYLFGSQANYDTFIATPAKFATLVGIE